MDAATRSMAAHLTPGTLVSYETTLPVGTTRGRYKPLIEEVSGLVEGVTTSSCSRPSASSRDASSRTWRATRSSCGGLSESGEARGVRLYEAVLSFDERDDLPRPNGVWPMGSRGRGDGQARRDHVPGRQHRPGEPVRALRGRGRHRRRPRHRGLQLQPYSHIHRPGIAVGGHCIPVYPRLYLAGDPDATVVSAARAANAAMPAYAVSRAASCWGLWRGCAWPS